MGDIKKISIETSVSKIKGVGVKYFEILQKRDINTALDILQIFPMFYIDFSNYEKKITDIYSVYKAKVLSIHQNRNFRSRVSLIRINVEVLDNTIEIVFFNKPYMKNALSKGDIFFLYGKIETSSNKYSIINPIVLIGDKDKILPIYKNIGKIKRGIIKKIILNALQAIDENDAILPEFLMKKNSFFNLKKSLHIIHTPDLLDDELLKRAKDLLKYNEFFFFQLELQFMRQLLLKQKRIFEYKFSSYLDNEIKKRLQFTLTNDQDKVFTEIKKSLSGSYSMAGLLHGDVGSGKTIIAFLSILISVTNGYQCAILVPTEVLAFQHMQSGKAFFTGYNIEVLTGNTTNKERKRIIDDMQSGKIDIIIGTHSLINEKIKFKNLSMIIIDEQHKFGVTQRATLFYKSKGVDLLAMTATPIPRTMLLSVYNDLKVFAIKDKPSERKPIKTKIIPAKEREQFYKWLFTKVKEGEKVYIILPLIENSDFFPNLHSIESEKSYFRESFKPYKIGVISRKVEKNKRDDILLKFKNGTINIIISTTVIEVGIDVKDATIMVIEDADRYGLSGLHQLRGRVGRGKKQSYCYLIPSKNINEIGKTRLRTIERENDGFKIAEIDLKMRGGGLVAGLMQSGVLNFVNGNINDDFHLYESAKEDAIATLKGEIIATKKINEHIKNIKKNITLINFS